jgi:prolyl oligopeptidase
MHPNRQAVAVVALAFAGLAPAATVPDATPATEPKVSADPYLWLEEVEGERALAWAREQNARTLAELQGDPRFARFEAEARRILEAKDRIADPVLLGGTVYNFWQDDVQVRGLLRRSDWQSYAAGEPKWESVLDVDALSAKDGKPWVTGIPDCLAPDYRRCLVSLSNGGKDATIVREFDLVTKQFVAGGFELPEAKHGVEWVNRDTLLLATDWGPGTLTESGYPFVVKRLKRGQKLADAVEIFRGESKDVGVFPASYLDRDGTRVLVLVRAQTFFEFTLHVLDGERLVQLPLPRRADLQGVWSGQLVASLNEDWTVGGRTYASGTVVSFPLAAFLKSGKPDVAVLFAPGPRESFQQFDASRSAAYLVVAENVVTRAYRYAFRDGRWERLGLVSLPPRSQITLGNIRADDDRAFLYSEGFTTPRSLYVSDGAGAPRRLDEMPARFDASRHVVEQFEATSKDGTKVPYFVVRPQDLKLDSNAPTLLYAYGGFQVTMSPSYSGTLGKL